MPTQLKVWINTSEVNPQYTTLTSGRLDKLFCMRCKYETWFRYLTKQTHNIHPRYRFIYITPGKTHLYHIKGFSGDNRS